MKAKVGTTMTRRVGWLFLALAVVLYAVVVYGHHAPNDSSAVIAKATVVGNLGTLRAIASTGEAQRLFFDSKGVIRMATVTRYRYEDAIRALLAETPRVLRATPPPEQ
jgi:hypothetical protein